jgi:hypothetical protein
VRGVRAYLTGPRKAITHIHTIVAINITLLADRRSSSMSVSLYANLASRVRSKLMTRSTDAYSDLIENQPLLPARHALSFTLLTHLSSPSLPNSLYYPSQLYSPEKADIHFDNPMSTAKISTYPPSNSNILGCMTEQRGIIEPKHLEVFVRLSVSTAVI